MTERLHIALMGIDGAGKSTIARRLADLLSRQGRQVEIVNFKKAMLRADPATRTILAHTAFASLKCQYWAAHASGTAVDFNSLLSERDLETGLAEAEQRLRSVLLSRNEPRPFLSSALLEVIGGLSVHTYIESRLRDGVAIIDESFAFKHGMKNVLLAHRMSEPNSPMRTAGTAILTAASAVFGVVLQPTHGYWIDTDPRLALRWRTLSGDSTTSFETYALAGERGDDSFLAMQDDSRLVFERAASEWSWHRITLRDVARELNIEHAIHEIEKTVTLNKPQGKVECL